MMFGSTPDPGESSPDSSIPFAIDLIGGPYDGGEHVLEPGWMVPTCLGLPSLKWQFMNWYVIQRNCSGSPEWDGRGRAVFDADLTRRMAK